MGAGWRVFRERFSRPLGGAGRYAATTNERNVVMVKEATMFKTHILNCQKAIRGMKAANEGMMSTVKSTMASPLPHTYDETAHAAGSQVQAALPIGGTTFSAELVQQAAQEAGHTVETQVLVPIQKWLDSYGSLVARFKEIDKLRMEVDSRKRTVHELASSTDHLRAKMNANPTGHDAKHQHKLDKTVQKLQHKEGKLKVATDSYDHQEALLFRDLCNLIKDAQWLKHHMQLAVRAQGESLLKAAEAFGELPPIPTIAPAEPAVMPIPDIPATNMPHPSPLGGSVMGGSVRGAESNAPSVVDHPIDSPARSEVGHSPSTVGPATPHREITAEPVSPPPPIAAKQQYVPQDNPFATL
jgi:hypothetical protein